MRQLIKVRVGRPFAALLALHCLFLTALAAAQSQPSSTLHLLISSETAPPGGSMQIKVWAASPKPIAGGRLFMYFDPSVFEKIEHVTVFSAAGDAYGSAAIQNSAIDLGFTSPSGGTGRLPDLPVFAVTASIRAGAAPGTRVRVSLDPSPQPWKDPQGNTYSVDVMAGTQTVGGTLSIQNVTPGGGVLRAGAVVRIDGTGFTTRTTLAIDGVSVSDVQVVGSRQINFTLGVAAELTGKHFRLSQDGAEVDYFSSFRAVPDANSERLLAGGEIIFPLRTYLIAEAGPLIGRTIALQNPTSAPVEVTIDRLGFLGFESDRSSFTIAPANVVASTIPAPSKTNTSFLLVRASAPIQMLDIAGFGGTLVLRALDPAIPSPQLLLTPDREAFSAQVGFPGQQTHPVGVYSTYDTVPFTVSVATTSGGNWLSASPNGSVACRVCSATARVALTVNSSFLASGTYLGMVTFTPTVAAASALSLPVQLFVGGLQANLFPRTFYTPDSQTVPPFQDVGISGATGSVSASATTETGGRWLSVTPGLSTTSSRSFRVSVNPSGLSVGIYQGSIGIAGVGEFLKLPVELRIGLPVPTAYVDFVASLAGPPRSRSAVGLLPSSGSPAAAVTTVDGGNWLMTKVDQGIPTFIADPAGLAPGTYLGFVLVPGSTIQVTFVVLPGPAPPLTVSPTSLVFNSDGITPGAYETLAITIGATADIQVQTSGPITAILQRTDVTHATLAVSAGASRPGVYSGSVTITADGQSVVVPFVLSVKPGAPVQPVIGSVVGGPSQARSGIAPGEIVTIHGDLIGPPVQSGLTLDSQGSSIATTLGDTRVLFDGIPVPVLYASQSQLNVIAPYRIAGQASTTLEVEYAGTRSQPIGIPVAPSAPGIFTIEGTGQGQAAVLNEDNSVNGPANRARRGSVVQIYATGEGLTSPPGITGSVTHADLKKPVLPVSVRIGGLDAFVTYAGSAPDSVTGLFQVNAIVPQGSAPDPAAPVILSVGAGRSPDGVTIAVR